MTMDLLIPDKVHDESRQGEALILEPVGKKMAASFILKAMAAP
jgi:virulence-associated protein VagC